MTSKNIYIELIIKNAIQNKYTLWYCNIINTAISRNLTRKQAQQIFGYIEGHHIIPKSFNLGGEKDPNNIALLTAKEHFVVHRLLIKMFDNQNFTRKMLHAMNRFNNYNAILTATQYSFAKKSGMKAKSQTSKITNNKRLQNNTHIFQSESFIQQQNIRKSEQTKIEIKNGNHLFQTKSHQNLLKETNKKIQTELVLAGLHHLQSKEHSERMSIRMKNDAANGCHIFSIKFFSIIETRKSYSKTHLSRYHPEFKKYY